MRCVSTSSAPCPVSKSESFSAQFVSLLLVSLLVLMSTIFHGLYNCRLKPLMMTRTYTSVVSTASRGIGLEFAFQLLNKPNTEIVLALCRSNTPSEGLVKLQKQYSSKLVVISGVDLESDTSIQSAVAKVAEQAPNGVDLLINCAGILGDNSKEMPGPERSIMKIDPAWLRKTMTVNFMSHVLMTQGIAPLMKRKKQKNGEILKDEDKAAIWNVSARVGSIGDNSMGGWTSYRCSKSALNQFTKNAAIELRRHHIGVYSIHPGTTDTDLSKPFQKNLPKGQLLSTQEACQHMMKVFDIAKLEDSGSFWAYDGSIIEW